MSFQAPRGMRDFYPEDMAFRNHLFAVWTETAVSHGFAQYDAPVVEHLDLLTRKAGEEVVEQIYAFEDKSGRQLALRPEVTPSLVRLVAARRNRMVMPIKWFTIAQCFRYERMARGRKREHFQWNLDILGSDDVTADVEVLATAIDALRRLGLTEHDVRVFVGSRKLVAEMLAAIGVPEEKQLGVFLVLDKRGQVPDAVLLEMLAEVGIAGEPASRIMSIFDVGSLDEAASHVGPVTRGDGAAEASGSNAKRGPRGEGGAESPAVAELRSLFHHAERAGVGSFLQFDIGVVRGLAYYTGIVFEAFDAKREFRAILGGGRYDRLFESLGEPPLPAVGFGFGDVVIQEVLEQRGLMPPVAPGVDVCVGAFDAEHWPPALAIANDLRREGLRVDLAIGAEGAKRLFKYADRRGAAWVVFLAPDELASGKAVVRDMSTKVQQAVAIPNVASTLQGR